MKKLLLLAGALLLGNLVMAQLPWPPTSPNPDSYGYIWKTSDASDGPTYNWIDIESTGTRVTGLADDGNAGPFNIGFDFQYYWVTRDEIYIGSNGFLSFDSDPIGSAPTIGFPPTPSPSVPNDVIAAYMCDLNPAGNNNPSEIFYQSDPANKQFVVTYKNVPYWTNNAFGFSGANTFQVILDGNDSTITVQYQSMNGSWNSSYNTATYPFMVGIENLSGSIGLKVPEDPVDLSKVPTNQSAIRFYAPANPSLQLPDAAISAVQNPTNGGFFIPWASSGGVFPDFRLKASVSSTGSGDINTGIEIRAEVADTTGQLFWFYDDNTTLASGLAKGLTEDIEFPQPFNPPLAGPYAYTVKVNNPNVIGDIISTNDQVTVEANVVDTLTQPVTMSYVSNNVFNIFNGGLINWTGTGGAGIFIEPFGYPVEVQGLQYCVFWDPATPPTEGFIAEIYAPDTLNPRLPGELLFRDSVDVNDLVSFDPSNTNVEYTTVTLPTPVEITEEMGGFFVGWTTTSDALFLITESALTGASPISRRSYEILGFNATDWAIYRSNQEDDIYIQALVNTSGAKAPTTDIDAEVLADLQVYPNPGNGLYTLNMELNRPQPVELRIYNIQGVKVYRKGFESRSNLSESIDLRHLEPGIYMLQVQTPAGSETRRLVKH